VSSNVWSNLIIYVVISQYQILLSDMCYTSFPHIVFTQTLCGVLFAASCMPNVQLCKRSWSPQWTSRFFSRRTALTSIQSFTTSGAWFSNESTWQKVQDVNDLMQRLIDVAAAAERSVIDDAIVQRRSVPMSAFGSHFSYDKIQGRSLYII